MFITSTQRIVQLIVFITVLASAAHSFAELPKFDESDPLPANLFIELAKLVNPAVVNISTSQLPPKGIRRGLDPRDPRSLFFRQFMGEEGFPQAQPRHSLGTGFVIREDGLIITNNHVIDAADVVKVQFINDGKEYEAEVIGKDKRTDLALLKINIKKKLTTLKLGTSKDLKVGEWVAAFGNPFGQGHTMTKGIISAKGRKIKEINKFDFLQTDASINPGNSGGPLVNTRGEVIGVNTAILAKAQGIGFAIPIDEVKIIVKKLEENGHIKRSYLGVSLGQMSARAMHALNLKNSKGALIVDVIANSPAEKSKLKPYDVITKFGKTVINTPQELINSVQDLDVGKTISIELIRNGKVKKLKLTAEEHPEEKNYVSKRKPKTYRGQKAPFDLGFKVANFSKKLAKNFQLPKLRKRHPVIIEVTPGSPASLAGLVPGDIILDVNRKATTKASHVIRYLKKDQLNLLRVIKHGRVNLIELKP
jgi:serine protease Do|nr:PDZ domain-containing protein [Pseudobdellovibrionaceae bacterium]